MSTVVYLHASSNFGVGVAIKIIKKLVQYYFVVSSTTSVHVHVK